MRSKINQNEKLQCLIIAGPTGVGKTELSIEIAEKVNGEIINADSRQIYKFIDIGSRKPTLAQLNRVKHHLYSIIEPDKEFSAGAYQELAIKTIFEIHKRKKIPILVGGSGLYIKSVIDGLIPVPKKK